MVVLDAIAASDPKAFEYQIATIEPADEMGDRFRAVGVDPVHCSGSNPAATLLSLVGAIRATHCDIIHVHSPLDRKYGHAAAFLTRRPVISHLHSSWDHRADHTPEGANPLLAALKHAKSGGRNWLEKRVVREYLAVSTDVERFFIGRRFDPVTRVENGIDRSRFPTDTGAAARARQAIGIRDGAIVMSVARLGAGKGHLDLIEVVAGGADEDWNLVLIGDGPLADDIRGRAIELGVQERLVMLGNRDDVPSLLPAADVWVLASETEGLPISVMEAMAAGRAICVYELPTLAEMLDGGKSGLLVEHRASSMASAIDDLLHDPRRRSALGAAASARAAERYDASVMAAGIEAAYRRALS